MISKKETTPSPRQQANIQFTAHSKMFKSRHLKKVTNAIKTVGTADLSEGLNSKSFAIDDLSRYGISGRPKAIAFDPVQSLLAIATDNSEVHIYGQQQVEVVISLTSNTPIEKLRFVKGIYLVGLDAKGTILVFSIHSKKVLSSFSPPGRVSSFETDPSLDWLLIGLENGSIVAYDIDRGTLTPFKVDNLQKVVLPKERFSPVVSIQWNPRDIGTVLVGYENSAVIYSIATGEIKLSFHYELPPNAPGGDGVINSRPRYPKVIQALYHPNSLNVLTAHDDGSLVFWDALTGKLLQARTLFDTDVNIPSRNKSSPSQNTRFLKLAWVTAHNPDDTTIIIAGGDARASDGIHNLSYLHYGVAPTYSITSYDKMNKYYAEPKQQRFLPVQNNSSVVDFLPLGQSSPYFSGGHNPDYIVIIVDSGEIETISYPDGISTYKSSIFPQGIAWIHPKTTATIAVPVPKKQWLGMISKSTKSENILKGGFPAKKPLVADEVRSALVTGHSNGMVRLWDSSHVELDESSVIDVNVAQALGTINNVEIEHISFAGETAELAVGTRGGDVALFKFDINRKFNPSVSSLEVEMQNLNINRSNQLLVDLSKRTPNIKEGFLPVTGIHGRRGPIAAIKNSNIGFVAISYKNGDFIIIDRRGPAVIFQDNIIGSSSNGQSQYLSNIEFSIMTYGDDSYSSILVFGGSDNGELFTYKILPESSGRFGAKLFDVVQTNDFGITQILPFKQVTGTPAIATFQDFNHLSDGLIISGSLILSSNKDIRILTPGKAKSSHKIFNSDIYTTGISVISIKNGSSSKPYGSVVSALSSTNTIKVLSLPELREISNLTLPFRINPLYGKYSAILPSGDAIVRLQETESALVNISGSGVQLHSAPSDKLFNDRLSLPYRPTIGTAQWIKGTTLITYDDLDLLIGGERRPAAKTKESQLIQGLIRNNNDERTDNEFAYNQPIRKRTTGGYDPTTYVMRTFQNGVDTVEESFNEYANAASQNMNEAIGDAKTDLVKSMMKSKLGF